MLVSEAAEADLLDLSLGQNGRILINMPPLCFLFSFLTIIGAINYLVF